MELSEDARLYTARDQDLGKIDPIIIDPVADKVTHLAVRNGIILSEPAGRHTSSWPTASQHPARHTDHFRPGNSRQQCEAGCCPNDHKRAASVRERGVPPPSSICAPAVPQAGYLKRPRRPPTQNRSLPKSCGRCPTSSCSGSPSSKSGPEPSRSHPSRSHPSQSHLSRSPMMRPRMVRSHMVMER